jgi:hypothetical protein
MIHATLTDGRTVLFGDDERVQAVAWNPESCFEQPMHLCGDPAAKLPDLRADLRRFVRVNHRGRWWPIAQLRRVPDPEDH